MCKIHLPQFRDLIVKVAVFLVLCIFCSRAYAQAGTSSDWSRLSSQKKVKIIVSELDRCPSWLRAEPDEFEYRVAILMICKRLSVFDTGTLRKGVERYWNDYCTSEYHPESENAEGLWNAAKVRLLIRVLFDIPNSVPYNPRMSNGEFRPPNRGSGLDMLYPLEIGVDGELVLSGRALGLYGGPPYDGLKDFDFVAASFQRRKEIRIRANCSDQVGRSLKGHCVTGDEPSQPPPVTSRTDGAPAETKPPVPPESSH
jgi:hypothetical protein